MASVEKPGSDSGSSPPRPQPALLKTIGVLNILFGTVLLLCGVGCLNATAPAALRSVPSRIDPETTQAVYDELRSEQIRFLRQREQAAATLAERAQLEKQRHEIEAKHAQVKDKIDFAKVNADLDWLTLYLKLDVLTGPVLNLLLVVSGVGLVLRRNWARLLGIATAALKLCRLTALTALLLLVVIPHVGSLLDTLTASEMGQQVITWAIARQQAEQGGAPMGPQPSPQELARLVRGTASGSAVFMLCLGAIYPVVALVLLTRPGARDACATAERESDVMPEFWREGGAAP